MEGLEVAVEDLDKVRRRLTRLRDLDRLSPEDANSCLVALFALREKLVKTLEGKSE